MKKNWDENNNWIGDKEPDSMDDWSVKPYDHASLKDIVSVFLEWVPGVLWFSVQLIERAFFLLLLWAGLKFFGVL